MVNHKHPKFAHPCHGMPKLPKLLKILIKLLLWPVHIFIFFTFVLYSTLLMPLYFMNYKWCVKLTTVYSFIIWHLYRLPLYLTAQVKIRGDVAGIKDGENVLVISNHIGAIDFLMYHEIANMKGMIPHCKYILKRSLGYIPVLGPSLHYLCFCFVDRCAQKDVQSIKKYVDYVHSNDIKHWLMLYPEGTRFTPRKKKMADEYCQQRGIPPFKNVLCPRTKGFKVFYENARHVYKNIVDITVDYRGASGERTVSKLYKFFTVEVDGTFLVDVRVVPMEDVRDSEEFMIECFRRKDRILSEWSEKDCYEE
ncbi:1-acylglycerol-3-phosphate O-acyltransferase [Vavraia culicis subsp. floridensis]|uniref:1-acylglycerol-3-phosphate O-acyltransferase n=1 Tax=Vavraia culicis (isolate floridensis) TaxID=948595 RepID=L2GRQ6_VAVCU|nr:1-acylglycerol-3-phosphate O-acyltransferase [Vavraia culicis subsp. floridensis]ELA46062.1 1-acylglycerol-3-phosphate O-acyltransferase [Vavraia culicis subsp. floridensis]